MEQHEVRDEAQRFYREEQQTLPKPIRAVILKGEQLVAEELRNDPDAQRGEAR